MKQNTSILTSRSAPLEQQVRARIDSMSYLPTTVAVAMKFMELGKDPEADPADYSKVISSDSSLSSKLLSLANSSWFGVRNRVTKVQVAVNLLGLGTVRTLAISYCVTGLHNELRLTPQESRMFWIAALGKAVAAKQYAMLFDPKLGEEAFAAGLFQDFALPVMYSTARDQVLEILGNKQLDWKERLQQERMLFRLDHAELARSIAQKLELPDLFVDAVAFHHRISSLREFIEKRPLADACYVASLFPHLMDAWNADDAEELTRYLATGVPEKPIVAEKFLDDVQREFEQLYRYFEQGDPPETTLNELMHQATCHAAREAADSTTRLVGTMQELMQQAASAGREVFHLLKQQDQLEEAVQRDKLTNLLNREGFAKQANEMLSTAYRYGTGFAIAYLDIDRFKSINDTAGHAVGDAAIEALAAEMRQNVRQNDLVARLGGDEFALLLSDCAEGHAMEVIQRILSSIASTTIAGAGTVTLSAGLLWVQPRGEPLPLEKFLSAADHLMYEAKRSGGNRIRSHTLAAAA